ncbi:hypothetical protein HPB52_010737 [Rhipicephalus sanguineus]|uniref:Uncharacterized protein n=1 Tax=Rhipicephalus sanguineus TaxID=34632 RepID=A0A9D4YN85_RHISA|nr:hypothetical protein HPB52_010737 [Rhipicephalus sanguineus]
MGHRMDVCPDPSNKLCRGSGISNPTEDHGCIPKCSLCGGNHLTADRACKARFKMSYIVRRRRWERRRAKEEYDAGRGNRDKRSPAGGPRRSASKQRDRSQTPDRSSNNSGGGNGRQSRSRSKPRSGSGKGGGNRRWETTNRTASESWASSKPGPARSPGPVRDPVPVQSPGTSQLSTEGTPKKRWAGPTGLPSLEPVKPNPHPSPLTPPNPLIYKRIRKGTLAK